MELASSTVVQKVAYEQIFQSANLDKRKTKIIATLGPQSSNAAQIVKLLDNGMNIARVDLAQGDLESNETYLDELSKALMMRSTKTCAVMVDLMGPAIRTGKNKDGGIIQLSIGQSLKIVSDMSVEGDGLTISTTYPLLSQYQRSDILGQYIYIADGELVCEVKSVDGDVIDVKCLNSYDLEGNQTVHIPGNAMDVYQPTEKDEMDIKQFVHKSQVDFLTVPCVRKPEEIQNVKEKLGIEGAHIRILAKIENHEGVENFEQILAESDGVVINRKTLGIEIPAEKVFIAQKWMTWKANLAAKTVIISSQILESMTKNVRPKEAEILDIANMIVDGSDAIQLGPETANGSNIEKSIVQLSKCTVEQEMMLDHAKYYEDIKMSSVISNGTAESGACAAVQTALDMKLNLILVLTESGNAARLIAKYKPEAQIFACAFPSLIVRQLQTVRGVYAHQLGAQYEDDENIEQVMVQEAKKQKLCNTGDKVIIMVSTNEENPDETTSMKIVDVKM